MAVKPVTMLVLSRGRGADLRRCITSAAATSGCSLRVVVGFDDDPIGYDTCPEYPGVYKMLLRPRHYYVRGFNALYEFSKQKFGDEFDYIVVTNDDAEWIKYGWASSAMQYINEAWEDGLGLMEMAGPEMCAHYMTRKELVEKYLDGQLANPVYTMYCSDTEVMARLRAVGKYHFAKDRRGDTAVKHITRDDDMREELRPWYYVDTVEYNKRARQFGWKELPIPGGGGVQ